MSLPDVVLANVLADALAHHEASDAPSLVRRAEPDGDAHWLDFQRAGEIAARALEYAGVVEGDGRLLFSVRSKAPHAFRAVASADTPGSASVSAGAASDDDWSELADRVVAQVEVEEPVAVLAARVRGLARRVMPKDAQRHNSLKAWMREFGVVDPQLRDLDRLTSAQLLRIMERLRYYGGISGRNGEATS